MEIKLREITVRELADGYQDNAENGVFGYGGKLDIRPPYQREFIYKDKQRAAVIDTIRRDYPLNVMYWAVREDGSFEVIDGQQRTISICQYVNKEFSFDMMYFQNLQKDQQEQILDYKLMIYICSGTPSEKLEWFKTINIAGEELTDQELRNAVYAGSWVSDAKRYFSKNGCAAYQIGKNYLKGNSIRQEYLEKTISWISKGNIDIYMAKHQHYPNANELWLYFKNVISWVEATFPKYRKEMKGVEWGLLYNKHNGKTFDTQEFESRISQLMIDRDVTNKKGIYEYILTGNEKHLSIRAFDDNDRREAYERQQGICICCKEKFEINEMEADHINPWSKGGKTISENCQMLCKTCNRTKSNV